jgi:UDP-glucose 4-epimerase
MRMLVTGGAGCIGSDLAAELIARGHDVVVFDNLSSGTLEHLGSLLDNERLKFVEGDVLDAPAVDTVMGGMEFVWHLAANPEVKYQPGDATDKDLRQNTIATYHVLDSMRRHGVPRLGFASTSAVYGISEVLPIPESYCGKPISLYGASKVACEALIASFSHLFGIRAAILRFANIVGGKVRTKGRTVISDFIHRLAEDPRHLRILGNGAQEKSYLLSGECVQAMLFVAENAPDPVAVYNIAGDDSITVRRIADMVASAMGLNNVQYSFTGTEGGWPGDVPRFVLNVRKLNALGWKARHNSGEAIQIAIEAGLQHLRRGPGAVAG